MPALLFPEVLHGLVDRVGQVRCGADQVITETRHERRVDLRAVRVFDGRIRDDHVRPIARRGVENREIRREQEERNMVVTVERAYLRQDAERRIIHNHRTARIVEPLVVPARIEGAHNLSRVDIIFTTCPVLYRLIHFWGGVAVIRGLLRFEFLHERAVIVNRLLSDAHFESPKSHVLPMSRSPVWTRTKTSSSKDCRATHYTTGKLVGLDFSGLPPNPIDCQPLAGEHMLSHYRPCPLAALLYCV